MTTKAPPPAKVQPDDVPVGLMFGLLMALVIVVIGVLALVWQFFGSSADKVIQKQFLAKPDRVLKQVTQRDKKLLANYSVVDGQKGIYRIPIKDAMRLLVTQPKLLEPRPMPPAPAKAAPAAPAAPGATIKAPAPEKAATPATAGKAAVPAKAPAKAVGGAAGIKR